MNTKCHCNSEEYMNAKTLQSSKLDITLFCNSAQNTNSSVENFSNSCIIISTGNTFQVECIHMTKVNFKTRVVRLFNAL